MITFFLAQCIRAISPSSHISLGMAGFGEVEADSAFGRRKMISSESGPADKTFSVTSWYMLSIFPIAWKIFFGNSLGEVGHYCCGDSF